MRLTSSFSSVISCCARLMVATSSAALSSALSVGGALRLLSSSMRIIFSLRARETACVASRCASACARAAATSSADITGDALSMRVRSACVTVTTPLSAAALAVRPCAALRLFGL